MNQVIFLGLADRYFEKYEDVFPHGNTDFFGISLTKQYKIYPMPLAQASYIFLIHRDIADEFTNETSWLSIGSPNNKNLFEAKFQLNTSEKKSTYFENLGVFQHSDWIVIPIQPNKLLIPSPGIYPVYLHQNNQKTQISNILFHYSKAPEFSADELYGLKSRLLSYSAVRLELKCDKCQDLIKTYTAIERDIKSEREGYIYHKNLPDFFECSCKEINYDLSYYRDSLHSVLTSESFDSDSNGGGSHYERLYSHKKISQTVENFINLIKEEKSENVIQKFIEENLVLLSRFNAKKVFIKPTIIGKFFADFAILDANRHLTFIEIERANMRLFQKSGHPKHELNHAYEQVRDWLLEYKTSSRQILDRMELSEKDVHSVKGLVIAGILENEDKEHYRKHQLKNVNNEIGFITFDELASSVLNLSRKLA